MLPPALTPLFLQMRCVFAGSDERELTYLHCRRRSRRYDRFIPMAHAQGRTGLTASASVLVSVAQEQSFARTWDDGTVDSPTQVGTCAMRV